MTTLTLTGSAGQTFTCAAASYPPVADPNREVAAGGLGSATETAGQYQLTAGSYLAVRAAWRVTLPPGTSLLGGSLSLPAALQPGYQAAASTLLVAAVTDPAPSFLSPVVASMTLGQLTAQTVQLGGALSPALLAALGQAVAGGQTVVTLVFAGAEEWLGTGAPPPGQGRGLILGTPVLRLALAPLQARAADQVRVHDAATPHGVWRLPVGDSINVDDSAAAAVPGGEFAGDRLLARERVTVRLTVRVGDHVGSGDLAAYGSPSDFIEPQPLALITPDVGPLGLLIDRDGGASVVSVQTPSRRYYVGNSPNIAFQLLTLTDDGQSYVPQDIGGWQLSLRLVARGAALPVIGGALTIADPGNGIATFQIQGGSLPGQPPPSPAPANSFSAIAAYDGQLSAVTADTPPQVLSSQLFAIYIDAPI